LTLIKMKKKMNLDGGVLLRIIVILAVVVLGVSSNGDPFVKRCETRYFNQPKDHFAFRPDQATFKHRVLYNLDSHNNNRNKGGVIFFYLGRVINHFFTIKNVKKLITLLL